MDFSALSQENDLLAQDNQIGLPTHVELESSPNTKWIEPFQNEIGEPDGGYWESFEPQNDSVLSNIKQKIENNPLGTKVKNFMSGNVTGGAAPIENNQTNLPVNSAPILLQGGVKYNEDSYDEIQNNQNIPVSEKIERIKQISENRKQEIEKADKSKMAKLILGAALQIGSAAIPMGTGLRVGGGVIKALTPKLGTKIAQEVGTGIASGAISGAVEGVGRGMLEDENLLKTATIGSSIGGVTGGLGGLGFGYGGRYFAGRKIKSLKGKRDLTSDEKKLINNYYADYERGLCTVNKNNFIGKIELPSQAMKETIKQQPQKAADVLGLSKSLKNANYLDTVPEWHKNKFGSDKFYHLENNGNEYIIANNPKNGKKYFHIIKDLNLAEPKSDGLNPTDIIPDYAENLKTKEENSINLIERLNFWLRHKMSK